MSTKINKEILENLGFRREEVSTEQSGDAPFVYYSLDIENVAFISSAWDDFETGAEEEYTVSFLDSDIYLDEGVLTRLIINLRDGNK